MATAWVSTEAGRHLRGRAAKHTAPELALRSALHRAGLRFRLHVRLAPGCNPDLILPRSRLAVWVHGCYWHSCPAHGRKTPFTGPNAALWEAKMRRTIERDRAAADTAKTLGWQPIQLWECEIVRDPPAAASRVGLAHHTRTPASR